MLGAPKDIFDVAPRYKALFQSIGLTAATVRPPTILQFLPDNPTRVRQIRSLI